MRARSAVAALACLLAACGPAVVVGSSWNADTGIHGTYDHFGNPPNGPATFICGVGFDLRYRGRVPLASVDVAVRYAPRFVALAHGQPGVTGEWIEAVRPRDSVNDHLLLAEAARAGHVSGSIGGICPNGARDLETLKGTVLRIRWSDDAGEHEERVEVERIRNLSRIWGGSASSDWQPVLEWGP
jgi:hypothetical protein